jgi:SDR family mycofactocin-dependent oxidoreductase
MGLLEGKVAVITGAARGQGRSHAVRLAEEGADIIAIDLCQSISTVPYALATSEDLAETAALVEKYDRRIVTIEADVRDLPAMHKAVSDGVAQLGRLDIVIANAGICPIGSTTPSEDQFRDVVDVNLTGVWNIVRASLPILVEQGDGGCVVITSSTGGLKGLGGSSGGGEGYTASKHAVVGLMRTWANQYGKHNIRVNTVHPTGVNTKMIVNPFLRDFLANDPSAVGTLQNLLPIDMIQPIDVSNAICWLVSDRARYVTGITLPVDAGVTVK